MLINSTIQKLFSAFVAFILLGGIGIALFIISKSIVSQAGYFRLDVPETYLLFFFFSLLICLGYGIIYLFILNMKNISLMARCIVCAITGTVIIYFFSMVGGGDLDFHDKREAVILLIVFVMAFILPYIQRMIYNKLSYKK